MASKVSEGRRMVFVSPELPVLGWARFAEGRTVAVEAEVLGGMIGALPVSELREPLLVLCLRSRWVSRLPWTLVLQFSAMQR